MVIIRLARYGRKKFPFYHIVIADKRRFRNAKFIQKLGFYNPFDVFIPNKGIYIDIKSVDLWIKNGAVLSKKVSYLFKKYKKISFYN